MRVGAVNVISFINISRYFGVDIGAIRDYAKQCDDIEHIRAEIR